MNNEYIGQSSKKWELVKFKYVADNKKEIAGKRSSLYERIALTLNGVIKRSKNEQEGLQPKDFDSYQIIKPNDLIFKMIDLENVNTSRVGLNPFEGVTSPAYIRFQVNSGNPKFLYYYFMSLYYSEVFNKMGNSGVRSALNAKDMGNILVPMPSSKVQNKIVDFLDKNCQAIDEIKNDLMVQIDKLTEYKEALVCETISNIDDCEIVRLSNVSSLTKGPFGSDMKKDLFVPKGENTKKVYIQVNCIEEDETLGEYYITNNYYYQMHRFSIQPKDFLITCDGTLGRIIQLSNNCEDGVISSSLLRVRTDPKKINSLYFKYCWEFVILKSILKETRNSCLVHLPSATLIGKFKIKLPKLSEQEQIIETLHKKCQAIDGLIKEKQNEIDRLDEYKKSLIYECVTGKREVL